MRSAVLLLSLSAAVIPSLTGCGDVATLPLKAGMGPEPTLPPPKHTLLPTVDNRPATRALMEVPSLTRARRA